MKNKDFIIDEDPIFDKFNEVTAGELTRSESISEANKRRMTDEVRKKLSESHKGKPASEDQKEKIKKWFQEVGFDEEAKKKMSEASKSKVITDETRKKLSEMNKGREFSEEHKKKISESKKGQGLGRKIPDEQVQRMRKTVMERPYAIYNGKEYTKDDLQKELGIPFPSYLSRIKSGAMKDKWGITFFETSKETGKKISEAKRKSAEERNEKPYAIYNGITYNIIELTAELGFPNNFKKINFVKKGISKNLWGLIFI